jgi:MFS family permease
VATGEGDEAPAIQTNLGMVLYPNFGPYLLGNLLSNCGTWFQNIAQALLIFRLTGSTLLVGVVNFAQFAGVFLLAPWAGTAADRFDRRRLLVVTQLFAVAVTAVLALLSAAGMAPAPVVILLAFVLGLSTAFAIPALQALVPLLVRKQDLQRAIAVNSVSFTLARAVGPALGAVIVHSMGISAAFGLNSLSYVALIIGLMLVKPAPQAVRHSERVKLSDSVKILKGDLRLALFLVAIVGVALASDPVSTLTPGFATDIYHRDDSLTGFLVAAFGLGSAIAGLTLASRSGEPERRIVVMAAVLAGAMVAFGLSSAVLVGLIALFIAGIGFLTATTSSTVAVQLEVDDSQRGRVMALWSVAFLGVRPFGSLVDGAVASAVGLRAAACLMAVPAAAVSVLMLVTLMRRKERTAAT